MPPPSLPPITIPSSLIAQPPLESTTQLPQPTFSPPVTESTISQPRLHPEPHRLPVREASTSLPALTSRESFLAEKEDEALLPLRPAEEDQRSELFGGMARGEGRGLRGAAQLHDEIGGQLAEVRRSS